MKNIFLLVLLAAAFMCVQCTLEQPLPGGYELLDREDVGGVQTPITIQASKTGIYWDQDIDGYADFFFLGNHQNVTSYLAIDCENLAQVNIDTATISSISLCLQASYMYEEQVDLNLSFYAMADEWSEYDLVLDDVTPFLESNPIEQVTTTVQDSEVVYIPFTNIDFFNTWITDLQEETEDMHGLIVKVNDSDPAAEFYSSDASSGVPYFQVISTLASTGDLDTVLVALTSDVNLVQFQNELTQGQVAHDPDRLRVGNGSGFHTLLQFDLSQIPQEATIHQALLTMYVDKEQSFTKTAGVEIAPITVTDDSLWQNMDTIVLDSSSTHYSDYAIATADTFLIESLNALYVLTSIVSNQNHESVDNYGIALVPENLTEDLQEMYFYSGSDDPALKPSLQVTYSLPASGRFDSDYSE